MPSTSGTGLCLKAMNVRTSRTKRRSMSARRGSVPPPAAKSATPAPDNDRNRKRTTINDIARMAAVSKKTVSRVINKSPYVREATRVKVKAIIAKTGFAPDPQARGLAFRRSFLLGLLYDNSNAQYIVDIQQGVLDCARQNTSWSFIPATGTARRSWTTCDRLSSGRSWSACFSFRRCRKTATWLSS